MAVICGLWGAGCDPVRANRSAQNVLDEDRLKIQTNAQLVIDKVGKQLGVELAYDEKSIEWVDGFINRNREGLDSHARHNLTHTLGAFLGETIVKTYVGQWTFDADRGWGVEIGDRMTVFPFVTTQDHFENGSEDSIAAFYKSIAPLME